MYMLVFEKFFCTLETKTVDVVPPQGAYDFGCSYHHIQSEWLIAKTKLLRFNIVVIITECLFEK